MSPADHIQEQINALQQKRNFNPLVGAIQLPPGDVEWRADYGALVALIGVARAGKMSVTIPYDPCGLDPLGTAPINQRIPVDQARMGRLRK